MSDTLTYQQTGTAARGQAHALFAQTMGPTSLPRRCWPRRSSWTS